MDKNYFNGKAVYVNKVHNEDAFTLGKVYEFNDGRTVDDDGTKRPHIALEPITASKQWFRKRFAQLIE